MTQGDVLVRLHRPEGYEDVHPELVLADAHIHPAFEPELVATDDAGELSWEHRERTIAEGKTLRTDGVGATPAPREITPEMMTEAAKRVGFDPVPGKLTRLAGVLNAMLAIGVEGRTK